LQERKPLSGHSPCLPITGIPKQPKKPFAFGSKEACLKKRRPDLTKLDNREKRADAKIDDQSGLLITILAQVQNIQVIKTG